MSTTLEDLLHQARNHPDQRRSALKAAFELADREGGWLSLLRGLRELGGASSEQLDAAMAGALEEGERTLAPWCFREVARCCAQDRDDLEGAARALAAGERALGEGGSALGLGLLAEEYAETLADDVSARRCLESALKLDRGLQNQTRVATALHTALGDTAGARALLATLPAPRDALEAWTLSNALSTLDLPEQARATLDAALERLRADSKRWSDPSGEALRLAQAAWSHAEHEAAGRALTLAEALATRPEELLDLVEACMVEGDPHEVARRAFRVAEERARTGRRGQPRETPEDLRHRLIPLALWLNEDEALTRLAPGGLRPPQRMRPRRKLPGFEPDASGLFDHLRARLTPAQLEQIAMADYGFEAALHRAHLEQIVADGRLPPRLTWNPGEVLRLTRWSEGERTDHVARAFCATMIILCSDDDMLGNDAIIVVESALALGPPCPDLALGLLVACATSRHAWQTDERIVALWGLALLVAASDRDDRRLEPIASALEAIARKAPEEDDPTLHGSLRYTLKERLWEVHIDRLLRPHAERPAIRRILALR